jgi:uncharacterized membrane protein (Fun14 family)
MYGFDVIVSPLNLLLYLSIESLIPALFSICTGGVIGFIVGFPIKKVMKILAVIVGVFFAALMYLQSLV